MPDAAMPDATTFGGAATWRALARDLDLRTDAFVDGAFRPAASGRRFGTVNPRPVPCTPT